MRADAWIAVTNIAQEQWGLIATDQFHRAGCTDREVERATERGLLVMYRRRVHLVAGAPASPYQPILAACLAAGESTLASFLAGAWLWDFDRVRSDHVEVTTLLGPTRDLADVRVHTTSKLLPGTSACRYRVPVTSAARTALDLSSILSPYLLARFVDHLHRRRLATYTEVDHQLVRLGGRGRSGTRKLRAVMAPRLEGLDPGDNDEEVRVISELIRLGVPRPEQQVQVVSGSKVYVLDAAWAVAKVGLELVGFDPHGRIRSTFDDDREREIRLRRVGWELVEVTTRTDLRLVAGYLRERLAVSE